MARRGVEFQLAGVGDFAKSLEGLRDDVHARVVDALDDSAHAIQAKAKTKVPLRRGDLARAIKIAGRGLARFVGLSDESIPSRGGKNSAHLNPWVYGQFVEFGLRSREMKTTPFIGPSVDEEEPAHNARVEKALDGAMGVV